MTYNQPTSRPLPATLPEYILVEVYASEFRGREQWVAEYRLARNGKASDYLKVVVNFRQHQGQHEGLWWVKPTTMAPQQWLVFATPHCRAGAHDVQLTVRMGEELVLPWDVEDNFNLVAHREGWTFRFASVMREPQFLEDELWRVQVNHIDLLRGNVIVSSLGPDPRVAAQLPGRVSYVGLYSLDGTLLVESDVYYCHAMAGEVELRVENARIVIKQARRHYGRLIGLVTIWANCSSQTHLAELVFVEGLLATRTDHEDVRRTSATPTGWQSFGAEDDVDRDDWADDIVRREEIENSERPDIDYNPEDIERYIYGADED